MKKIYNVMILAAVAAAALVSCAKEMDKPEVAPQGEGIKVTVVTANEVETKTALSGENSVVWRNGLDKLGLVNSTAKELVESEAAAVNGEGQATFDATVTNAGTFFAFYPYATPSTTSTLSDGGNAIVRIEREQNPTATSFDPAADILVSETFEVGAGDIATANTLKFKRLGAFLKITFDDKTDGKKLSEEYVKKITVQSIGEGGDESKGQSLVGTPIINSTGIVEPQAGYKSVIGTFEENTFAVSNSSHAAYLGIIPITLPKNSQLKITAEFNGYSFTKTITLSTKAIEVGSGDILPIQVGVTDEYLIKTIKLNKVVGIYGKAGVAGWPAYVPSGSLADVLDDNAQLRNATFDKDYIYVAQSEKWADNDNNQPYIYMFNTSDGTLAGHVTPATDPAYMGTYGGTHPVSCVRFIENTNPSLNGGKPILIASNLSIGQNVRVYAWTNGTNNQPTLLTNIGNARRWGDKFSVQGTYQSAYLWFRSNDETAKVAFVRLDESYTEGFNGSCAWYWLEPRGDMPVEDAETISEYYTFGSGNYGLIATNSNKGLHLMNGDTEVKKYPKYARSFGWHAFTFDGVDYLAFLDASDGLNKPRITVLEGKTDSVAHLQETIDNGKIAARVSIASADPYDFSTSTTYAHQNLGDCQVRVLDDGVYILGMIRGGVALFKVALP